MGLDWLGIGVHVSGEFPEATQTALFKLYRALCDAVPVGEEKPLLHEFKGERLVVSHDMTKAGHDIIRLAAKDWCGFVLQPGRNDGEVELHGTVYSACLWSAMDPYEIHAWLVGELSEWLRSYMPVGVLPTFVLDVRSRFDLAADVAGCDLNSQMHGVRAHERYVSRSRYFDPKIVNGEYETVYFGKRSGDGIMLRAYDKLKKSRKDGSLKRWLNLWEQAGYDGLQAVTRNEFQVTGAHIMQLLGACGVTFEDCQRDGSLIHLFAHLEEIWAYLTHKWIRHTIPNFKDTRRSRWRTSKYWECVSQPWEQTEPVDVPPHLERLVSHDAPKLFAQAAGCVTSAVACMPGSHDMEETELEAAVAKQIWRAIQRQRVKAGVAGTGDLLLRKKYRMGLTA